MDNISKLQELIDNSNKIVFFTGAGVSTESGIPDFRSKDGLYNQTWDYSPEEILSHHFFNNNPKEFYRFYKQKLNTLNKEPNIFHKYLKKLEEKDKLLGIITQNIDGLHEKAGNKNIALLHGTIYKNTCIKCGKSYNAEYIFNSNDIPICSCGSIIKPDVVLYEEALDEDTVNKAIFWLENADLLIIAGTSLTVYPASSFIHYYGGKNIVIINKDKTAFEKEATLVLHDSIGNIFKNLK